MNRDDVCIDKHESWNWVDGDCEDEKDKENSIHHVRKLDLYPIKSQKEIKSNII